jgi:predicted O-linked N-acetylglucosamine transferase (SPINDLY family)
MARRKIAFQEFMTTQQQLDAALAHQRARRLREAEEIYRQILAREPRQAGIMNNLANILKDCGRIEEAVDLCRKALEIEPQNAAIHSSLCYKLHFHPDYDRAAIFKELREWDRRHGGPTPPPPRRTSGQRIRVGYVSPDFYGHAECFFVLPLLDAHDREEFEIHCYASVRHPDRVTELMKSATEIWHDVLPLSDEQLAWKIREDRLDILVDLTMHMAFNRLPTFAAKSAPVQVAWLAYPGGTGLSAIDYRLTDAWMDPPGESDAYYAEKSIRLPDCWCCYRPLGDVPPAKPRAAGPVMFGSLNNPCKLTRPTLRLWANLLRDVTDSRLLLLTNSDEQRQRMVRDFHDGGVDRHRLEFVGYGPRGEYLRHYDRSDIALDPLPYNGITTTCDALWMGVPVVSFLGRTAAGRAGLSILSNLQLGDLIAADESQFLRIATALANDPAKRRELRANLRQRMDQSPLMDARRFTRNLESVYRDIHTA